jgi:hypothetical protein
MINETVQTAAQSGIVGVYDYSFATFINIHRDFVLEGMDNYRMQKTLYQSW